MLSCYCQLEELLLLTINQKQNNSTLKVLIHLLLKDSLQVTDEFGLVNFSLLDFNKIPVSIFCYFNVENFSE